jgi:outer membrane protein assembly factor BamB
MNTTVRRASVKTRKLVVSGAISVIVLSLVAYAADWPQWRGPQRNAISSETGLLKQSPKDSPKLLWQNKDIGDGYSTLGKVGNPDQRPSHACSPSTPTVGGNTVYALSSDGDLASLDAATGKVNSKKSRRADSGGQPHTWAHTESPLIDVDALIVTPGGAGRRHRSGLHHVRRRLPLHPRHWHALVLRLQCQVVRVAR